MDSNKINILDLLESKYKEQDDKNDLQYIIKEYALRNGMPLYSHEEIIRKINKEYGTKELCNNINKFKLNK